MVYIKVCHTILYWLCCILRFGSYMSWTSPYQFELSEAVPYHPILVDTLAGSNKKHWKPVLVKGACYTISTMLYQTNNVLVHFSILVLWTLVFRPRLVKWKWHQIPFYLFYSSCLFPFSVFFANLWLEMLIFRVFSSW